MRVLVTGSRGLLGAAIVREFERDCEMHAFDHASLDISDQDAVARVIRSTRPETIINCAAYNDVDSAEEHAALALEVNGLGVLSLARGARECGATLVHYGTDFVFDGETDRPYVETDAPRPLGVYGASKLLGEWFALEASGAYVLRVESLFGQPGAGTVRLGSLAAVMDRIRAGDEVPVFVDRTVSPSYTADVARATRQLVVMRPEPGVYNCVNGGTATWAEIAAEGARLLDRPLRLRPITLATAGLRAKRPRYCALDPAKLALVGIRMPEWRDALARYVHATG